MRVNAIALIRMLALIPMFTVIKNMKFDFKTIARFTEVTNGVAIVISLIFIGVQFGGNIKATRSATASATSSIIAKWYTDIGSNEQSAALFWNFMADPDTLSPQKRFQAIMNIHGLMLIFQNSYYLAKEGTLDMQIQESLTIVIYGIKDQPGFELYWKSRKSIFLEEFQIYIDKIMTSESKKAISEGIYKKINPEQ